MNNAPQYTEKTVVLTESEYIKLEFKAFKKGISIGKFLRSSIRAIADEKNRQPDQEQSKPPISPTPTPTPHKAA